ncbi:MAG: RluA family pseudouridine synthase [Clostridiales bacterium]|nr:RluA family pseudouridine synthase [Clostridiales bacterium]
MIKITITENEEKQRLDRFLKKYLRNAPLSYIYKLIRKNVKVNGKRVSQETELLKGDELALYISEEEASSYFAVKKQGTAKRQFKIAYEDENVLIAEKPLGLLTHGTAEEKKDTLANQVIGYLVEKGDYVPRRDKTFTPSPVNRLDRNTTGMVIFAKTYPAARVLTRMIREKGFVRKYYLTVVYGHLEKELHLVDRMEKDSRTNQVRVLPQTAEEGKVMETVARPLQKLGNCTLVEVELVTGRSHQIRAHLGKAGYPVIGDEKYGNPRFNRTVKERFGLSTQFLHAYRLCFDEAPEPLENLKGKEVRSELPPLLQKMKDGLQK